MTYKTMIVVSGMVDATIREYQPDIDIKIFRSLSELGSYVDTQPIRADILFFTKDVVGTTNSAFEYLYSLLTNNSYLAVDRVIYITEENAAELASYNFLIESKEIDNWEYVTGSMSRAYVTEVINGTFRSDKFDSKRKAVYRTPRAEYVKQQLKNKDSLEEEYIDDEKDLMDIPDEEIPEIKVVEHRDILQRVYIAGESGYERSVFAFLAAQYLSLTNKVLIVESDPDYHTITEFSTKSNVEATRVSMSMLFEDPARFFTVVKQAEHNLVIVECIDRITFDYKYICSLIFYNLVEDFDFLIYEMSLDDIPSKTHVTITVPSTVIGTLRVGEAVDKSLVPYCSFIGVNIKQLPELHINSGVVMSTLLSDLMSTKNIICPVITVSTLKLVGTAYDFGAILGKGVMV